MFSLPIMEPSLSYTNVKIITIPIGSFINDWIFESDLMIKLTITITTTIMIKIMIMMMIMMIKVPQRASVRFTLCWQWTPTKITQGMNT